MPRMWNSPIIVIDEITVTRGINNRQPESDSTLFDISRDTLNRDRLRSFVVRLRNILLRVEGSVEQGVDQG